MRRACTLPLLVFLLAPVVAQDKPETKYENADLSLSFEGVYGWDRLVAEATGAWTELARYRQPAFDANVVMLVRDNPYETRSDLRKALVNEFSTGEPLA